MELNAVYGSKVIDANTNAQLRGSGNYNPPPTYEQTTDRGNAYVDALNMYENSSGKQCSEPQSMPIHQEQMKIWHNKKDQDSVITETEETTQQVPPAAKEELPVK